MLEAMVAIIVLSVGLLGVAGLQLVGLRNNGSANLRGQAAWYAAEMIEEVRGRRDFLIANPTSADLIGAIDTFSCTGSPGATSSLQTWRARVACALPGGRGGVAYDTSSRRLTVIVQWDDSRGANALDTPDTTVCGNATTATTPTFCLETMI